VKHTQSIDLLHKAFEQEHSGAFWAQQLNVTRAAISLARVKGRLSPTLAAGLARLIDPARVPQWTALAAIEAEPDSYIKAKVHRPLQDALSYLSTLLRGRKGTRPSLVNACRTVTR